MIRSLKRWFDRVDRVADVNSYHRGGPATDKFSEAALALLNDADEVPDEPSDPLAKAELDDHRSKGALAKR